MAIVVAWLADGWWFPVALFLFPVFVKTRRYWPTWLFAALTAMFFLFATLPRDALCAPEGCRQGVSTIRHVLVGGGVCALVLGAFLTFALWPVTGARGETRAVEPVKPNPGYCPGCEQLVPGHAMDWLNDEYLCTSCRCRIEGYARGQLGDPDADMSAIEAPSKQGAWLWFYLCHKDRPVCIDCSEVVAVVASERDPYKTQIQVGTNPLTRNYLVWGGLEETLRRVQTARTQERGEQLQPRFITAPRFNQR